MRGRCPHCHRLIELIEEDGTFEPHLPTGWMGSLGARCPGSWEYAPDPRRLWVLAFLLAWAIVAFLLH